MIFLYSKKEPKCYCYTINTKAPSDSICQVCKEKNVVIISSTTPSEGEG